jgi:hypothetical protein
VDGGEGDEVGDGVQVKIGFAWFGLEPRRGPGEAVMMVHAYNGLDEWMGNAHDDGWI